MARLVQALQEVFRNGQPVESRMVAPTLEAVLPQANEQADKLGRQMFIWQHPDGTFEANTGHRPSEATLKGRTFGSANAELGGGQMLPFPAAAAAGAGGASLADYQNAFAPGGGGGGGQTSVPTPSPAPDLNGYLQAFAPQEPKSSAVERYGAQILHGLGRGVAAIPGSVGDMQRLAAHGLEWAGSKVAPQTTADVVKAVGPLAEAVAAPSSEQTVGAAERNLIGPRPTPQSGGERFAGNVAGYIPAALLPMGDMGLASRAALGAASGVASEGAKEAGLPAWAQVGAGLAPGLGLAGVSALRSKLGAPGILRDVTQDITPQQWDAAAARQAASQQAGLPLMAHEALAPDVGINQLGQLAGDIKATPMGGRILNPVFEARPQQAQQAALKATASLGPAMSADDVLRQTQSVAQGAIDAATKARTRATSSLFKAAGQFDVPATSVQPIIDNIDTAIGTVGAKSDLATKLRSIRGQLIDANGVPTTRTSQLSQVYKELRDSLDLSPDMGGAARSTYGVLKPLASDINRTLEANNPIYAQASQLYQKMSEPVAFLNGVPGQRPLTYRIANATSNEALRRTMLDPENISPQDVAHIGQMFQQAGKPEALQGWMRHYLETALDKSSKDLGSGANPALGAAWRNTIAGGPNKSAVLHSYLNQIDPTGQASQGFTNLLDIMKRTNKTPGQGSPTFQRQALNETLGQSPGAMATSAGAAAALGAAGVPSGQIAVGYLVGNRVLGMIKSQAAKMGAKQIATLLTDPRGVEKLRALSTRDPSTPIGMATALAVLGGTGADTQK